MGEDSLGLLLLLLLLMLDDLHAHIVTIPVGGAMVILVGDIAYPLLLLLCSHSLSHALSDEEAVTVFPVIVIVIVEDSTRPSSSSYSSQLI